MNNASRFALCMALAFSSRPGVWGAEQARVYPTMTDAFQAGIDQNKFVLIFFHDSSTASHPNTDLMWPVAQRMAAEPLILHHVVLGSVDLAHDEAGLAVAKNLNQSCAAARCPDGNITAPTLSLFLPDSKKIAEIARLVGFQHDDAVRNMLVERMCESIKRRDASAPPMDDEIAETCKGMAESRPSTLVNGWTHVDDRAGGFSIDLPGIPREFDRKIELAGVQLTAHYLSCEFAGETASVVFSDYDNFDPNAARQAFRSDLPALGKIESVTDVRFAGYPALRYVVEPKMGTRIEGIYFIAGRRAYSLLHQGSSDYLLALSAGEFFDSFRLSPGK